MFGKLLTYTAMHTLSALHGGIKKLWLNMAHLSKKLSIRSGENGYIVYELVFEYRMTQSDQ